jgi:hypothetical protein
MPSSTPCTRLLLRRPWRPTPLTHLREQTRRRKRRRRQALLHLRERLLQDGSRGRRGAQSATSRNAFHTTSSGSTSRSSRARTRSLSARTHACRLDETITPPLRSCLGCARMVPHEMKTNPNTKLDTKLNTAMLAQSLANLHTHVLPGYTHTHKHTHTRDAIHTHTHTHTHTHRRCCGRNGQSATAPTYMTSHWSCHPRSRCGSQCANAAGTSPSICPRSR